MSVIIDKMNKAIQTGERQAVITVFTNICAVDPSFSTGNFDEALKYAEVNFGKDKLYTEYDGGDLFESSSDKEDFGKAVVAMENNFCETRVNATRALGIRLYRKVEVKTEKKDSPPHGAVSPKEEKSNWGLLVAIILLLILGVGIGIAMIMKNLK